MNTVEIRAELVSTFTARIQALEACKNNDYILVFPHGLGVRFNKEGVPFCSSLDVAETIVPEHNNMPEEAWAFTPIVKNGKGEQARIMPRQRAIARELESLREHLATLAA